MALWILGTVPVWSQVPEIGPTRQLRRASPPLSLHGIEDPEELARVTLRVRELRERTAAEQAKAPRPKLEARAEDGIDVGQQGAAATAPGAGRERYLQSHGAAPCVIVTLYDPETKTGALSHFDAGTGVAASLELMIGSMGLPEETRLQARLIGGMEGLSDSLFLQLVRELDRRGVEILEADMKGRDEKAPPRRFRIPRLDGGYDERELPGLLIDSIVFDTETGAAYDMEGLPPQEHRPGPPDLTRPSGHVVIMMKRGLLRD